MMMLAGPPAWVMATQAERAAHLAHSLSLAGVSLATMTSSLQLKGATSS